MKIPARGTSEAAILRTLEEYRAADLDLHTGRIFAYGYHPDREVEETSLKAFEMYLADNALDPTTFPATVRIEREVVRMIANLLRGDDKVVGSFTSGGTESILLAVKTARDKARADRPDITAPEMVLPKSAHCAFHKACHYFGIKPVVVGIDPKTLRADLNAFRAAITPRTIFAAGSAPQYAHGVIDPIQDMAGICQEKGIWFHVDGCVGGIQLSFMRQMEGFNVPPFDFTVPGVMSISTDMHKYGYSPKGASIVLYRNKELRRHQIYASIDSATYALVNPNIQSTRSGGPMAGAWATIMRLGEEGYREIFRPVMDATRMMIERINATKDLYVLGKPDFCMFAVASDSLNVFELADEMRLRDWYLQPQFSTEYSPMNLHFSLSLRNIPVLDKFFASLDESLAVLRQQPPLSVNTVRAQVAEMMHGASSQADVVGQLWSTAGLAGGELPERMALINTLLECLPREIGANVLAEFVNELYV